MSARGLLLLSLVVASSAAAEPYASALGPLEVEVRAREVILTAGEGTNPCGFTKGQELFRGVRAGGLARGAMTLCQVGPRCAQLERADAVLALVRRGAVVIVAVAPETEGVCPRTTIGPIFATRSRATLEFKVPPPKVPVVPSPVDACARAEGMRGEALRALNAKELGQAAGLIAAAVGLCPASRPARLTAGEIALARGRLSEAEAIGGALVDEDPLDAAAHKLIARSLAGRYPRRAEARERISVYLSTR